MLYLYIFLKFYLLGTLDEKEKLTNRVRKANDDAQRDFACGLILSDVFKKDYAQNMVDLQRVNSSIERQFRLVLKYFILINNFNFLVKSNNIRVSLSSAMDQTQWNKLWTKPLI